LQRLSFATVNHLNELNGIEDCPNLSVLWVEGAKHLARLDAVAALKNLETLNLSDCPNIRTLRPLRGLPHLQTVWFFGKTNILDGDLSPLKTLPQLQYAKFV